MTTVLEPNLDLDAERLLTAADIVKRFGAIPFWRIRFTPPLGFKLMLRELFAELDES